MNTAPILAPGILILIGVMLVAIRMAALYRVLVRTGSGRYRTVVIRWAGLTLAAVLLVVAAFRPGLISAADQQDPPKPAALGSSNVNVFFVVDRSVESRAEDYGDRQSRMSGIRSDIEALIGEYPQARFSVLSFASGAEVDWPLSQDLWALKPTIAGMSPYIVVSDDAPFTTNSGAADQLLGDQLKRAKELYPKSKNLVFYLGSGASLSKAAQTALALPEGTLDAGAVLGYGTPGGVPIPKGWVDRKLVYFGGDARSTLDDARLKQIAQQLGVQYYHRESGQGIAAVAPSVESEAAPDSEDVLVATRVIDRVELYWLFTLLAAALVLVEIYLTVIDYRRSRLARRGAA